MSIWDVVANVATGGAYGLVEAGVDASSSPPAPPPPPSGRGIGSIITGIAAAENSAQSAGGTARPAPCCDRYRLNDGFLVDGVTGLVWKFDESRNALVEVPRMPAEHKKPLLNAMLAARLHTARSEFENAWAVAASPGHREQIDKDFEKHIAQPMRDATGLG